MSAADAIRARFAPVPRWLGIFWAAAFVTLVLVPVALNAEREAEYSASVEAFPINHPGFRPVADPLAYVRSLLRDPLLARRTVEASNLAIDEDTLLSRISTERTPRSVLITARADTPEASADLVDTLATVLANTSAQLLLSQADRQVTELRRELAADPSNSAVRASLEAARANASRIRSRPIYGLSIGPRPGPPRLHRTLDRVLGYLPGPLPPRHGLLSVAISGLLVALLVCGASYVFWSRRASGA
jgi:hypothetical protein